MAKKKTVPEATERALSALQAATKGMTTLDRVYVLDAVAEYVRLALQGISRESIASRLTPAQRDEGRDEEAR